ncbi:MAG: hypothetical protein WCF90_11020 [Methanomicrobiales archaeon]
MSDSIFSIALEKYGFAEIGAILSFIVLTAASSWANCEFYGADRAMYGLSPDGMAPKIFSRLNRNSVPMMGTFITLAVCWLVLSLWEFANWEG